LAVWYVVVQAVSLKCSTSLYVVVALTLVGLLRLGNMVYRLYVSWKLAGC